MPQTFIPYLIMAAALILMIRRNLRANRIRVQTLWIFPVVLLLIAAVSIGQSPPRDAVGIAILAAGVAAGAVAWLAGPIQWQLVIFGAVALAGLAGLRKMGVLKKREVDAQRNADVNLDIGQQVEVTAWKADGTAQVSYRGAAWQADLAEGEEAPRPGIHVIAAVRGSRLVLARKRG